MANFNSNDPDKGGYFSEYVNFDQFLMQHNIGQTSPFYNPPQFYGAPYYNTNNPYSLSFPANNGTNNGFMPQQQQSVFSPSNGFNLAQNSNLLATASEFVPQQIPSIQSPTVSSLFASANEFIPKSHSAFDDQSKSADNSSASSTKETKKPNGGHVLDWKSDKSSRVSSSNNNNNNNTDCEVKAKAQSVDSPSKADALLNALSKTRISDAADIESKPLDRSGGAIKKIRNQNRYDSRESISNGNRFGNKKQLEHSRYGDVRRRDHRKNENNHYGSGRMSSSHYDNNRHYNTENDNSSDHSQASPTNNRKPNRYGGNGKANKNQYGEAENGSKANGKYNNKDKRYESSANNNNKKADDSKNNRNGKMHGTKVNNIHKFDSTNCSQREKLIREIDAGKLECLVCCEMIKPFHSVWSCSNCYHIIHLNCVIKWAASSKSEEGWRCCACQNMSKAIPFEYYCFCGKSKNPQYNRNDVAHSCGEPCGRSETCDHPCTQLCHPGPCPPCCAMVTRSCGCGKTQKMLQCGQKSDLECDQQCEKELNCKMHKCEKPCHSSTCGDCDKEVEQTCYCERDKKSVPCTEESNESLRYSCFRVCNKALKCKNHKCKWLCHDGECGDCKLLPEVVTTCPCGKMILAPDQRKSCKDPIPLCTGTCKKVLPCGPPANHHTCVSKCHTGPCPPCNKQTSVKCRCGNMDQMIKCNQLSTRADDARCKKRCTKKRSCGKHKCNQECCIDIDHECPMKCTYTLSCGKHKCESTCHKGRCVPCYRSSFDELYCECGANVIYPPVPCGTKRPACTKPCSRSHPCDHPVTHNCHSAQTCPPCMAFTTQYCHGKHEQRKIIPCSQPEFSCGLPCNKALKCGQHKCIKTCHPGVCESETEVCKQNCTKPRIMCPHNCNAPCHLDTECPDTPCRETVEVLCQCGLRKQTRTCHDFSSEFRKISSSQLASSMQQMQNGGQIELSDVLGPIKTTNNKTLECNEECRMQERNRRLAIGLQIRNPDLPSKLQPKYSEFIRGWAKKDPKLVTMVHDELTKLVKLAKESKQKSRSFSFPTMNREKRQLVHEMCGMFGVESVAYDAEPNRNVVATAQRETSWLPSMSVTELIQRENGQRRIPVPVNAWGIKR